jgi:predicted nucleotidyltransferase
VPSDLHKILRHLHAEATEFIVVGGMAMVSYGSATITGDLDLCYRRTSDNLERLVRALRPLGPRLRGAPPGLPFLWDARTLRNGLNFTLTTDVGDVDLLSELSGIGGFDALLPQAEALEIAGQRTLIIGLEQLISAKRAAGRPKDLIHVQELEEIKRRR